MEVTLTTILPLNVGSETERICLLVVASIVLVIGTFGNGLTLVALPYVRWMYPTSEFTILRNNTADLIINLALCDFIYCSGGIAHFVHVLSIGGYPYRDGFLGGDTMCFWQAAVRHVAAISGFFTLGGIALSIYLRQLRRGIRRQVGDRRRGLAYLGIAGIWIISFLSTLGDFLGLIGEYRWSGTVNGCDAVYTERKNWIDPTIIILNFAIMGISYGLLLRKLRRGAKYAKRNENLSDLRLIRAHMRMPVVIPLTYAACILPNMVAEWGIFHHIRDSDGEHLENHNAFKNITTALLWCLPGINFILYMAAEPGMRAVYRRALLDLCPPAETRITMSISQSTLEQCNATIELKHQVSETTLNTTLSSMCNTSDSVSLPNQ